MRQGAGLLVGATTHDAWDAFTHASGSMLQWLDALRAPVLQMGGRTFRLKAGSKLSANR